MVLHLLLSSVASNLSVLATVTPMIADIVLFGVFFGLAIVMFVAALIRQTYLSALLSSVLWFGLSFAVWTFGEATSGLTAGTSFICLGLGAIMLVLGIFFAFKFMQDSTKAKQDEMVEGEYL